MKLKPDSETSLHSTCAFYCRTFTSCFFFFFHLNCKITQQFCIEHEHKCTTSKLMLVYESTPTEKEEECGRLERAE